MADYGDDFLVLTDEDGTEYELEVLATVEYGGHTYKALVPAVSEDPDSEYDEVSILRVAEEDGEELLEAIEDDSELEAVYALLLEMDDSPFELDSGEEGEA